MFYYKRYAMASDWKKTLFSSIDRVMFIGIGVGGTILTSYITGVLKGPPPKLVVSQIYNDVDNAPIPTKIGSLKLDYKVTSNPGCGD